MLDFLKKKIQEGIAKLTGGIKKEVVTEETAPKKEEVKEVKQKEQKHEKEEKKKEEHHKEEKKHEGQKETEKKEPKQKVEKEKFSLGDLFTKKTLSEEKFDELFWDIEIGLLESNIAMEVIEKIKIDLKGVLVDKKINRFKIEETIKDTLQNSLKEILNIKHEDLVKEIKATKKRPYVIVLIGINGGGKTTSIAKLTHYFLKQKLTCVIAACDTFRAAAIHQVEEHANRLGVKLIKHDYGADAAAVAFDTKEHAKAKNIDVVFIDTAGRNHANDNLMDELHKLIKVTEPDKIIFVGDALTGNDAVEQAREFHDKVGIDGIILSKFDCDEKGGCAISMSYITKKPILYIGTGQTYDDLIPFDPQIILDKLSIEKSEEVEHSHILEELKEEKGIVETKEEKQEIEEEMADEELKEAEEKEEELQEEAIAKEEIEETIVTDDDEIKEEIKEEIKQEEVKEIQEEFEEEQIEEKIKEEEQKEELEEPIAEIKEKEVKEELEEEKEIEVEEQEIEEEKDEIEYKKQKREIKIEREIDEKIEKQFEKKHEEKKKPKETKKEEHKPKEIIKEQKVEKKEPVHTHKEKEIKQKEPEKKKEIEKKTEPKKEEKKKEKPKEHKVEKKVEHKKVEKEEEKKKEEPKHKETKKEEHKEKAEEPKKEEKKIGFWGRLFGKK